MSISPQINFPPLAISHAIAHIDYLWKCFDIGIVDDDNFHLTPSNMAVYHKLASDIEDLNDFLLNTNISINVIKNITINDIDKNVRNLYKNKLALSLANYFTYCQDPASQMVVPAPKILPHLYMPHLTTNAKAIMILDDITVPPSLYITITLGNKFIYSSRTNKSQLTHLKTAVDNLPVHPSVSIPLKMEVQRLHFDSPRRCLMHNDNYNHMTAYLRRCLYISNKILASNNDICVVEADKGSINVVMSKHSYLVKVKQHIDEGINDGIYSQTIDISNIDSILKLKYQHAHEIYQIWIKNAAIWGYKIKPMPQYVTGQYIIPLYGTIKIHKESMPIRPIVADINNALRIIQDALIPVLNKFIHQRKNITYDFIMPNSVSVIKSLDSLRKSRADRILMQGHKLYTMDFVSMYTNINLDIFFKIISKQYDECNIQELHIPLDNLLELLKICLKDFSYITVPYMDSNITLKQTKGIPMGGKLSYHISEIVTSHALHTLINIMPLNTFSFIFKYVDDLFLAIDPMILPEIISKFELILPGMPLKFTKENSSLSVDYLDITFARHGRNIVHTWFRKPYSSGRSINFYSAHPLHMKINTYKTMLTNALYISNHKKAKVYKMFTEIMKNNNYPTDIIMRLIAEVNTHTTVQQ